MLQQQCLFPCHTQKLTILCVIVVEKIVLCCIMTIYAIVLCQIGTRLSNIRNKIILT